MECEHGFNRHCPKEKEEKKKAKKKLKIETQKKPSARKRTFRARRNGSQTYSTIFSTRIQPIVRIANARIRGFGSLASYFVVEKSLGQIWVFWVSKMGVCFAEQACTYVLESVDSKNSAIRLGLSVIHDVEIDKFLQLQIVGLNAV
jgi:hypothetical protein